MKTNMITVATMAVWGWAMMTSGLRAEDPAKPKVDPLELKAVPNISLAEEPAELAKNVGKIVRLRFSYRTAKPTAMEDGKAVVEVMHDVVKGGLAKVETATLVVPPDGTAWLGKVKPQGRSSSSEFVYARVVGNRRVEALGTKIVNGSKGPDLAW